MSATPNQHAPRKQRIGLVVSAKMQKTLVVRVERRFRHPQFKKVVTRYKKYYVHDEKQQGRSGDRVRIEETRPLSKLKAWRLTEVLERGNAVDTAADAGGAQ